MMEAALQQSTADRTADEFYVSKRSPSSSKEKIGAYTTSVLYVHVRVQIIYVLKCKVRHWHGTCMYVRTYVCNVRTLLTYV